MDAHTPDVNRLRYHGCRLLFELTTPDAHFPPGEQAGDIRALAAHFKKQCTQVMAAVLGRDVLQRLTDALAPALSGVEVGEVRGRTPECSVESGGGGREQGVQFEQRTVVSGDGNMDEDDCVMSSASAALKMVHNLLLYSDERSAQLRKSLMQSQMVKLVLEPFLNR